MAKTARAIPKNVDEYLSAVPADQRKVLQQLRRTIKEAAPRAEEVISYQVPTYKYFGPVVVFAAFPKHCSLIVISPTILKMFAKELEPFKTAGRTIHFTPEKPLSPKLIQKIVKTRIKENEERQNAKTISTATENKKIERTPGSAVNYQ